VLLGKGKNGAEVLAGMAVTGAVALAKGGIARVRVVLGVKGFVTVTTMVVSKGVEEELNIEVVVLVTFEGEWGGGVGEESTGEDSVGGDGGGHDGGQGGVER
jgi:hypothetical protein